jgi:GTP cyclohydrolase I
MNKIVKFNERPKSKRSADRPARSDAEEAVHTLIRWAGDDPNREGLRVSLTRQENTMRKVDGQIVETPVEARAGFLDRPVLVVLVVSVLLAVGAFMLVSVGVF